MAVNRWVRWGFGGTLVGVVVGTLLINLPARSDSGPAEIARERVSLAGIPVAGKSREEVQKLAAEYSARLLASPMVVRLGKSSERTTGAKLGVQTDVRATVDAVFVASREPTGLLDRIREKFAGPPVRNVPFPARVNEASVAKGLMRFSVRTGTEPKNARLTKVKGQFTAIPPKPGKELDASALSSTMQAALDEPGYRRRLATGLTETSDRGEWLKGAEPITLDAATRTAKARIGLDDLKPITARLASFSTGLGGSSRNRVHNISLACKAIDGAVLLPGDVFSYNDTVGPRVPSAGFRDAPVIIRGELQPGTGGGICQVSTTLYNAALLADLQILRRSHHAFPVHYVPAGRDATVVDGAIDFKFKNRLTHPIALDAKVTGGRVSFHLYGHPDDRRGVELMREGLSTVAAGLETIEDPKLPAGKRITEKRAMIGRKVTLRRIVKRDGEIVRNEVISRDYYRPIKAVVRVGTGEVTPDEPGSEVEDPAAKPVKPDVKPAKATPADVGTLRPAATPAARIGSDRARAAADHSGQ
jgi:vancomycin resistance protein YoaR